MGALLAELCIVAGRRTYRNGVMVYKSNNNNDNNDDNNKPPLKRSKPLPLSSASFGYLLL
jgi:hypothetical protein